MTVMKTVITEYLKTGNDISLLCCQILDTDTNLFKTVLYYSKFSILLNLLLFSA